MTILCIETSTSVCSAAVCKDGKPLKQCICLEGSNHARLLPLYIQELLLFAKEQHIAIEAVALSEGPGSYTGLRIGTSTAKGICYGLDIPLIPVPTLLVLCAAAKEKGTTGLLCPMIDARRMEVYTALYDADLHPLSKVKAVVVENENSLLSLSESGLSSLSEGGLSSLSEGGLSSLSEAVYFFGDGAAKCQAVFTNPDWHYIPGIVPQAAHIGWLIANGQWSAAEKLAYYEPFYLKEFIAAQSHVKGLN